MTGKNIIYFKPANQYENTGDILINKSLLSLIEMYGEIIIDDTNRPEWFLTELGGDLKRLSEVSNRSVGKTLLLHLLKEKFSDKHKNHIYYILPPGHTSRSGFKIAIQALRNSLKLAMYASLGCRIIRLGFSIGPFDSLNAKIEALSSNFYSYYGVRDNKSLQLAVDNNFNSPKYSPDLAWAYNSEAVADQPQNGYIVLSFRSNSFGREHDPNYILPTIETLKLLLGRSFINNLRVIISYQVKYDYPPSLQIYNSLKAEGILVELMSEKLLLADAAKLYKGARCVISNRLHVLLLAFGVDTLSFPLIYQSDNGKIINIYNDNGLSDLILDQNEDVDIAAGKLQNAFNIEDSILSKYRIQKDKNTTQIIANLNVIFNKDV